MAEAHFLIFRQNRFKIRHISWKHWCLGEIFLEYSEAEIPEILTMPEAQMKNGILIEKNRCIEDYHLYCP